MGGSPSLLRRPYLAGMALLSLGLAVLVMVVTCRHAPPISSETEITALMAGIAVDHHRDANISRQYERSAWKHWVDADHDCQNTREEILIRDTSAIAFTDARACRIVSGHWHDAYSGLDFTSPRDLDVDHVVPLKDAHVSGGHAWSAEDKERFANDLREPYFLRAVSAAVNRAKSDHSPDEWMPPSAAFHCQYLHDWVRIKAAWRLSMTQSEHQFIGKRLADCP